MTQIKIVTGHNLPNLETSVNAFLKENDATIAEIKDIQFELHRSAAPAGMPGSALAIAYITYISKK